MSSRRSQNPFLSCDTERQKGVGGWEKPWSNHPAGCLLLRKGLGWADCSCLDGSGQDSASAEFVDATKEGWTCQGDTQPSGITQDGSHRRMCPCVLVLCWIRTGSRVQRAPRMCFPGPPVLRWSGTAQTPSPPSHPLLCPWEQSWSCGFATSPSAHPPRLPEEAFELRERRKQSQDEERPLRNGGAVTNRSSPGPRACRAPCFLCEVPVTKARF